MIFQLMILLLFQVTLVLNAVTPGIEKIEAKCWGPGVWPHPRFCRLFSVCILDPSNTHNMISGQLFMCPPETGFSMGRSGCFQKELVTNCFHNAKNSDDILESSPAEHLLPIEQANRFHCAGHTVPYCDGSDILVVCGLNQGLLGAVNCSSHNSGQRQCDKKLGKCVFIPHPARDTLDGTNLRTERGNSKSEGSRNELTIRRPDMAMATENTARSSTIKTKKQETSDRYGESYSFSKSVTQDDEPDENIYIPSHTELEELSATCRRPGKQCTIRNHTLLIECSNDLEVVHVWDCYSFFPFIFFQAELGVKVSCDSKQDSCTVRVGNMPDENLEEEIHKISQQVMKEKDREAQKSDKVTVEDLAAYTCPHPGQQCIPNNNTIIVECSKDLKVVQVWDCASVFPADPLSVLTNIYFRCDPQSNSCAMNVGHDLQEPSLDITSLLPNNLKGSFAVPSSDNRNDTSRTTVSFSTNNPQDSSKKLAALSTHSPQDILMKTIHFPADNPQKSLRNFENPSPNTQEDALEKNAVHLYKIVEESLKRNDSTPLNSEPDLMKELGDLSTNLQDILMSSAIPLSNTPHSHSNHEVEAYNCQHPGFQCTTKNSSLLLECSDDLRLLNVQPCSSLFPFAVKNGMNAVCDPQRDNCVVFLDEQQAFIADNKLYNNKNSLRENDIAEYQCVKEGMHCSTKNSSIVLECSENLKLLHVWDCSSLMSAEIQNINLSVTCDQFYDSCIIYPGNGDKHLKSLDAAESLVTEETTVKDLLKTKYEQYQLCTKPGKQCTVHNTSILIECSEDMKVLHMWNCASLFPPEASKENSKIYCSLKENKCVMFYPGTSTGSFKFVPNTSTSIYIETSPQILSKTTSETSTDDDQEDNDSYYDEEEEESLSENQTTESVPMGPENLVLQNCKNEGLQCSDNTTIMDCPFDLSEPNFAMSCSDMIQITHNEKAFGYCDDQQSSCLLKVNEEKFKLKLSRFDIGEHSVFPDFISKCQQGGLHCADNVTLVMCSGDEDNIDYAITCAYSSKTIQAFCDHETESCFMDTETPMSESTAVPQLTVSEGDTDGIITPERILEMSSVPGMFVTALKELSAHFDSSASLSSPSVFPPTTPGPLNSSASYKMGMVNSQNITSQLKQLSPAKSLNEAEVCRNPGWRCLNQDVLILCSEELLLQGFLPCSEVHIHGYCENSTSQCVREKSSSASNSACTRPGLQCLDDSTIGVCSFMLKIEYSLPCASVHPESSCNSQLVACISQSLHATHTPT